jgi:hypothetical protein
MTTEHHLELHKLMSGELRYTSTAIWQFSIAIVTLQGGAVGLSAQSGFESVLGKCVLATGFFLSVCFSIMLVRQAVERKGFVRRMGAVEEELRKIYPPGVFACLPKTFSWFTSVVLAWILLGESVIGFALFISYLLKK